MVQAKFKGWKRLAASLVLLPGLTAVGAEVLHLLGTAQAEERPAAQSDMAKVETAKNMMLQARAAYNKGEYAKAQDLAQQIKAMNVGMPWWNDDSPDNLLADIKRKNGGKLPNKTTATSEDPRTLVRQARQQLDAGHIDKAQDLARQAEANGRNADWGLFEDTPSSLHKEIQKARSKRDRAAADKLITQARYYYERRTPNDEVRAVNLDKARSMALEAAQLHGPYGIFDFGDRPESLIKEIDQARSKLKVVARKPEAKKNTRLADAKEKAPSFDAETKTAGYNLLKPQGDDAMRGGIVVSKPGGSAGGSGVGQGKILPPPDPDLVLDGPPAGSPYNPPGADSGKAGQASQVAQPVNPDGHGNLRKAQAVALMKQAHACEVEFRFVEAREHLARAQKHNAVFGPDEESPERALQMLMSTAQRHIDKLCREAHEKMLKKTPADLAESEHKLNEAETIALGLSLDRYAVNGLRDSLRVIKGRTEIAVNPSIDPPALHRPGFEPPPGVVLPGTIKPVDPLVAAPHDPDAPGRAVVMPAGQPAAAGDQGMELLRQAHNELHASRLENARKIAAQVFNGPYPYKNEAQELLRTIDAEELEQKRLTARRSYEHAVVAYQQRNYEQALSIFKLIDPTLLAPQQRASMGQLMTVAARAAEKPAGIVRAGGAGAPTQLPPIGQGNGSDNVLKQEEAMRELRFQKLRAKGLEVEAAATARFGKGETDAALADLNGFIAEAKSSNLDQAKVALLVRPVESRMERLKVLKHQQDFLTKEAKDLKSFRANMSQEALQKEYRKEQVSQLMKDYKRLVDEGKYQEAGKVALRARELEPDDPSVTAAMQMARMLDHKKQWTDVRDEGDEWRFKIGNNAFKIGPDVDTDDPVRFDKETFNRIRNRQNISGGINMLRPQSDKEREIERTLNSKTVSFNFKQTPLDEVVGYFQTYTGINFDIDTRALQQDGIDPKQPITSMMSNQKLSSALSVVFEKANLRYIIHKELVRVTTQRGARGSLVRRTIPVADLVVPVPNFSPSPVGDLNNILQYNLANNRPQLPGSATTPFTPLRGLNMGMGSPTGTPSLNGGRLVNSTPGGGGALRSEVRAPEGTIEELLIRLITNSVQPDSWEAMGGPGKVEYYPLGMALVINQTPDVIEQVIQLLESLRQLQDLEIAIEVRMVTLAESFYERIGVDFSMNLSTHNSNALVNLAQNQGGLFSNFQNLKNNGVGKVVGLAVPGVPTPDLNVPIAPSSFGMAVPPFGGFPNAPGADGGVSLGLAFLSDVQVQLFLEAAQGDRRTNVMQAPKLTMFNGQSANLTVQDFQYFMTGVSVTTVNGQLVFTPQNTPIPLGPVNMALQPVVSGDRRFVRLNIQQSMRNLASATVPLFPITTIVTPVFDGGAQGQPVPFTQYIQQPAFTQISVMTTVVVPDGGTVLLGGLKTLSEGRNEFGPPVLGKIPYLDRLFRNVAYGRDVQTLMMMVTPRIIINREEQERQTGVRDIIEEQP